jgi:outer membrane protein assembly factor BamB
VKRMIFALTVCAALPLAARADDWPQWLGPQRDGVWRETGLVEKFPDGGPKILWRVPVAGGYAGPAVANGRVYLTDFATDADVRKNSDPQKRPEIQGKERVLCLDAATGKEIWKHEYDCPYAISYPCGPRCTPTVSGGKVYTLGSEGDLRCLDADKGTLIWSKSFKKDYGVPTPIWGFCGHPLVDGQKVITLVGGEGSVVVAFDKDTGKELWKALSAKEPGYSTPEIIQAGGVRQLVVWHAESVNGLEPETGKVYWTVPLAPSFGMAIMAPRKEGDYLFAGGITNVPGRGVAVVLKLATDKPAVSEVWRSDKEKDKAVYPVNMTPFIENDLIYGVDQPGQLRAVKLATGERVWETAEPVTGKRAAPTGTAFLVKNGDRFFVFNELGELLIAKLSAKGYEEVSRAKIVEPTGVAFGRDVVWSHPAFANKCAFIRNDKELVCVSLAAPKAGE